MWAGGCDSTDDPSGDGWTYSRAPPPPPPPPTPSCSGSHPRSGTAGGSTSVGMFSGGYDNGDICSYSLSCPQGTTIELSFSDLDTESNFDYVSVYDGSSSSSTRLGHFSGTSTPSAVTGSGNTMLVKLTADSSNHRQGFTASFTCARASCSGTHRRSGTVGTATTVASANGYSDNDSCSYSLSCPHGGWIELSFSDLDTESNFDYVSVYDGSSSSSTRLGHFSGTLAQALAPSRTCASICTAQHCGSDCPICAGTAAGTPGNGCHGCESSVQCDSGDSFTVSGGGLSGVNGAYIAAAIPSYSGPQTYVKGNFTLFRCASTHLVISDLGSSMDNFAEARWLYKVVSSADAPPVSASWIVAVSGTAPAPEVVTTGIAG
eukprot:COSAG06_NODE_14772_length_1127_cov_1.392023_1_plen_375_part_11